MMKTKSLLLTTLFTTAMAAQAAVVIVPTGLSYGDQYRLVFQTSTTRDATATNIADYNTFVNNAAALNSDLDGITWTAIASTSDTVGDGISARVNTGTTGAGTGIGIYLLNDTQIATSYTDFWDTTITSTITIDESGNTATGDVWSGTLSTGLPQAGFERELGDASPWFSRPKLTNWLHHNVTSNATNLSLYAMSEVLTVVPEPSSTALLGLGGLALMLRRKRS